MNERDCNIKRIAKYAETYREEELSDEPWRDCGPFGLTFFLKRAFASARREELSAEYREAAEEVIECSKNEIRNCFENDVNVTDLDLSDDLEDEGVGNQNDRKMVVDILEFLETLPGDDPDIYDYVEKKVDDDDESLEDAFENLTDIFNIGPKKATLFLRDAVVLCGCEDGVEEYRYVLPIDT